MAENKPTMGIINEVGDLGLGFDECSEKEQEQIREQLEFEKEK